MIIKEIPGYEGLYQITDDGRIFSSKRKGHCGGEIYPTMNNGYLRISLRNHSHLKKSKYVHRLVAETFLTNGSEKPCINHKDGNKINNNVKNLEWCTYSENMKHAQQHGLANQPHYYGEKHPNSKISDNDVDTIRHLYDLGERPVDIAKKYGVTKDQIYNIVHNKQRQKRWRDE